MKVAVEDGSAVELRGDRNHSVHYGGFLRQKVTCYLERLHLQDRLTRPANAADPAFQSTSKLNRLFQLKSRTTSN
jgi:hypothetical protein